MIYFKWFEVMMILISLCIIFIVHARPRNDKQQSSEQDQYEYNKRDKDLTNAIDDSFSWVDLLSAVQNLPSKASYPPPKVKERDGHGNAQINIRHETQEVGTQIHKEICGTRPAKVKERGTRRIIGGKQAESGEFPWQVSVMRTASDKSEKPVLTCGGALISARTVLTACHCLKLPADRYEVWVGRISSMVEVEECHDQKFFVVGIFKHPDFNPDTLQNDVAVLSISSKYNQGVRWSDWVLPICLPHTLHHHMLYTAGTDAVVAGWGLLQEDDKYMSRNLQHVTVPIVSLADCNIAYDGLTTLIESQICAGDKNGGRDACAGDSGGPLTVIDSSSERFYVVGIVSFGMGCGRQEYPGVYTKVDNFTPWILKTVGQIEQVNTDQFHLETISPLSTTTSVGSTTAPTSSPTILSTSRLTTTSKMPTTIAPTTRPATLSLPTRYDLGPVCKGYYKWAICRTRGQVIRVISGSYGRPAGSNDCNGLLVPWWMKGRECSLPSAGAELARACNGKKNCRITTRDGSRNIFSRNPCIRQRPFVTMRYMCETSRGGMQRSLNIDQEEIFIQAEEGIDYDDMTDDKYTNYIKQS